ncbi:cytoplasmic protein [Cyathus striatus]|nr:cytoplasmic protein [Cyathus striatus]
MDVYTTAFTYPRSPPFSHPAPPLPPPRTQSYYAQTPLDYGHPPPRPPSERAIENTETVKTLTQRSRSHYSSHAAFTTVDQRSYNFIITGTSQNVANARAMILKECPVEHFTTIRAPRSDILDSPFTSPAIKPFVRDSLDDVASQTGAHISVVNVPPNLSNRLATDGNGSAGMSGLESERVCEFLISGSEDAIDIARIKLLVMLDTLSGLHAEPCEIDHKLHSIIAGRKRHDLQVIQEETATNIYLPSPLLGLVNGEKHKSGSSSSIAARCANTIWITGEFFGVQRARDMLTNAAMLKAKSVVSRDASVMPRKMDWMITEKADDLKTFMSDNASYIEFPGLGSSTSLISVYGDNRVNIQRTIRSVMQLACQFYVASFWLLPMQYNALIPPLSINSTMIGFKNDTFEVHGLEAEVRNAVGMLFETDLVKTFHHEILFKLELSNEYREFITGKKNGKINKIMQTTNVKIKLDTPDVQILAGLTMLQEELPSEISFYVPEAYHKRIIGVGGRSIQRIMKKYGVYVKFSNSEEFAQLGGYNDNSDNVIARTPTKNSSNLENLRVSVMELVGAKDKDFVNETVSIPRRYHRVLLGEKSIFIHDIEAKTNSRVFFPDKSSASDIVTIFGPESQVQIAATMLLDHVPFEADWNVHSHPDLSRVCTSKEFTDLVERIKQELHVAITPNLQPVSSPTNGVEQPTEVTFKFRCQRSNSDYLVTARELLEQFLNNNQITPQFSRANVHKRSDSFADSFAHFDSKVLPTSRARGHESMDMGRSSGVPNVLGDNRHVKSLFQSPVYIYEKEKEVAYGHPPVSFEGFRQQPPIGSGIPHRTRHSEDAMKRGSDSSLEAKLMGQQSLTKPRSLQNRAQSLDLTMSLARVAESPASLNLGPPDSPTLSGCDTGGDSSPSSLTFPSVYAQPSMASSRGHSSESPPTEEITRAFSNFGL